MFGETSDTESYYLSNVVVRRPGGRLSAFQTVRVAPHRHSTPLVTTSREDSVSENGANFRQATSEEVEITVCEQ